MIYISNDYVINWFIVKYNLSIFHENSKLRCKSSN